MRQVRVAVLCGAVGLACTFGAPGAAADGAPDPDDVARIARLLEPARSVAVAQELVERGAAAVPALAAALKDPKLRAPVLDVITRIGPDAKDAVPAVSAIVRLQRNPARPAAARALGAIGADAASTLNNLLVYVNDERATGREEAVAAMGQILVSQAARLRKPAPPSAVDAALAAGADWLLRHQSEDGRWSCNLFAKTCKSDPACTGSGEWSYDVGVTALATMALLHVPSGPAAESARAGAAAGITFLRSTQDGGGAFGSREPLHWVYNHAAATSAVAEVAVATGDSALRAPLERAVTVLLDHRHPKFGWRYAPKDETSDTSLTAWCAKALEAAQVAGVSVPAEGMAGAMAWVELLTEPEFGRTGYQQRGGPPARTSEMYDRFPAERSESLVACGLTVRLLAGHSRETDSLISRGLELVAAKKPRWDPAAGCIDFYYWMHGSWVMRAMSGKEYVAWRTALVGALVPSQRVVAVGGPCGAGSWDPLDPWAPEGGRVYTTAMAMLALEYCAEDPASRPPLPSTSIGALAALEAAAGSDAAEPVRTAARRALEGVRNAYR